MFKHLGFLLTAMLTSAFCGRAQLAINEVSQGTSGNKEYVEFVVNGTHTCNDTAADLRGWIFDDNGGWYGTSAISAGCYHFPAIANWAAVPYGSIILIYNDGDKNTAITQADDPTDANHDGVYILPISSSYLEMNASTPNSSSGSAFSYPTTGFTSQGGWTNMALNNNGDAVATISPTALSTAYSAITYGNLSGGVHIGASGGQTVYYATGSQFNSSAGWTSGAAPTYETPGAPNNTANQTWINSLKQIVSGGTINNTVYDTTCANVPYHFNGNTYNTSGTYIGHFTSIHGCDSIVTLHLTVKSALNPPSVVSPVTYCQGASSIPLTANGQNLLWYTTLSGTGSSTAPTPPTTNDGKQIFYVSQTMNGCESPKDSIIVIVKPRPTPPQVTSPVIYCKNESAAPLAAIGQNLMWYTDPAGLSGVLNPIVPKTIAGGNTNYYVTQEINGCESDKAIITVTINEVIANYISNKDSLCTADTIRLADNSKGNAIGYTWNFGDGNTATGAQTTHIFSQPGNYGIKLISTDNTGCKDSISKAFLVLPTPQFDFAIADSLLCQGQAAQITSHFSDGYMYADWDFGDGTVIAKAQNPQHAFDSAGSFTIKVTARYSVCPEKTIEHDVLVKNAPKVYIGPDTSVCPGNAPVTLYDRYYNPANTYTWSNGTTGARITTQQPDTYWLTASNGQCSSTDTAVVWRSCYVDIPNAFTPNDDGSNDYFFPRQLLSRALIAFHMQIFNRWGQLIFETTSTDGRGWDGKLNGISQPTGVYIYMIEAAFENNVQEKYQGNLTLLR
ncbi:PKD domain-containing protein [Taibaiella soli]|uniref:PKD domain-containing protein n=1 Tax=Taibaiella soli TaxID=1649169 RepID=A0A2W2B075_9BACT|nr:PKD domain-containing protein [Taibaiella soli]PZF73654.1 hypothetical protein DN068_06555 [Taibaiella soli]